MPNIQKTALKQETNYLANKLKIKQFLADISFADILRYVVEDLDRIDDLTTSQNIEMFKLVSSLEDALQAYSRLFKDHDKENQKP